MMKANEFIKEFGLDRAREYLLNLYFHDDIDVDLSDLKRLVKSHELVASWGGLADAKVAVKVSRHKKYLKRAIDDVESCMGVLE